MCQMFYLDHDKCTCIYDPKHFAPCAAQTLAHGLSQISGAFAEPVGMPAEPDPFAVLENPFAALEVPFVDPVLKYKIIKLAPRPKPPAQTYKSLNITHDGIDMYL